MIALAANATPMTMAACRTIEPQFMGMRRLRARPMAGSNQPQGQLPGRTGVAGNEVMNMLGDGNAFDIAAGLDFGSDIFRDVLRPMFKRIEGDNADRVVELPGHEIGDDSFEVCPLDLGFAVDGTQSAKAVDYKVDGLISAVGHDPWRPTGAGHTHLPRNTTPQIQFGLDHIVRATKSRAPDCSEALQGRQGTSPRRL